MSRSSLWENNQAGRDEEKMPKSEDYIYGRQAVKEAMQAGSVKNVVILKGRKGPVIQEIISLAQKNDIDYEYKNNKDFERMGINSSASGGIAARVSPYAYLNIEQFIKKLSTVRGNSLVLMLDHIEDPHNLGALLRTAEATGADGVIIPSDRAAGVTSTVRKVAAGATEWIPAVKVVNLARAADLLKERGFWIYGAEQGGDVPFYRAEWDRPVALVLGSEGKGISRLMQKKCDLLINIPMAGILNSLNVSVAGGILMYEYFRRKMT